MYLVSQRHPNVVELIRHERRAFAAKLRIARALLNWSQTELAQRTGLTQRAIHKLEQGETEPRRTTVYAVEQVFRAAGVVFEDAAEGFHLAVTGDLLDQSAGHASQQIADKRLDLGVTSKAPRTAAYRS